jgi:cell division protein FtsN
MKIFLFLICLLPIIGSAIMFFEVLFGRLFTGEKLTIAGKRILRSIAVSGLMADVSILGGVFVRGFGRLVFYYGKQKTKLIKPQKKALPGQVEEEQDDESGVTQTSKATQTNGNITNFQKSTVKKETPNQEEPEQKNVTESQKPQDIKGVQRNEQQTLNPNSIRSRINQTKPKTPQSTPTPTPEAKNQVKQPPVAKVNTPQELQQKETSTLLEDLKKQEKEALVPIKQAEEKENPKLAQLLKDTLTHKLGDKK